MFTGALRLRMYLFDFVSPSSDRSGTSVEHPAILSDAICSSTGIKRNRRTDRRTFRPFQVITSPAQLAELLVSCDRR